MKKFVFSLTLLLFISNLFSQTPTNLKYSRDYYLIKSKKQKKAAKIMLTGGALFTVTAFLIPKGKELTGGGFFFGPEYKNDGIKAALGTVGFLSMLTSIPLYKASSRNKRKSASLSLKNESVPQIYQSGQVSLEKKINSPQTCFEFLIAQHVISGGKVDKCTQKFSTPTDSRQSFHR